MDSRIQSLFDDFIREKTFVANLSPRTIHYYKQVFRAFRDTGAFDNLCKLSLSDSIITLRERGTSAGAINTYIRGVNCFLNWLYHEHNYDRLAMKLLKGGTTVMRSLTDTEVKALMGWKPRTGCEKRLKVLVLTLLDTGTRIDEILSLRRDKVDFDNLLMTVTGKGNKTRTIPFSVELRKVLYKFSGTHKHPIIFCTVQGSKMHYCNVMRDFTRMTDSLGIKIQNSSFHALRRTFATNFIKNGGNPFVLQRLLGHSSISQTQTYIKLVTDDLSIAHTSVLGRLR